ncbi:MAG: transporter [Hyphomicrobiaceae bacterium]|nr:transporter [Hyphomicrobiaceae bacterium]
MRFTALVGAGTAALLTATSAHAHHPGGAGNVGGAGPIVTISADTLAQGQSAVSIMFELTKIGAFSDAQLSDFASKHIHAHSMDAILSPSLAVAYGITNTLMISARLPYVSRTDIREGHHEHHHGAPATNEAVARGDADGIGDLSAMLQWRFVDNKESGTRWALLGGAKAPTGATDVKDKAGELFELEFQPGSGGWDWMLGLAASQSFGLLSFHANALYTFVGEGDQRTDLGDRFQYNLAVAYRLFGGSSGESSGSRHMHLGGPPMYHGAGRSLKDHHEHTESPAGPAFDLVLELNGEWHSRETIAGVEEPNSGGNVVYLAPGARLSGGRWSAFTSFGIPVVNNLYGVQAEPDYRLLSGISVTF